MGTFPWPFSYRIPFLVSTKWLYSRASSVAIFWLCWLGFRTRLTAGETEKPWEKGLLEQAPYNAPVSGSSPLPLGSGERLLKLQSKLPLDTHCNLCVFRCLQLTDSDNWLWPWPHLPGFRLCWACALSLWLLLDGNATILSQRPISILRQTV